MKKVKSFSIMSSFAEIGDGGSGGGSDTPTPSGAETDNAYIGAGSLFGASGGFFIQI